MAAVRRASPSRNVAAQRADPASTLHLCRDLIALRRAEFAGQLASYTQLDAPAGVWAYRTGRLTVVANFTGSPVSLAEAGGVAGEVLIRSDSCCGRRGGPGWPLGGGDRPVSVTGWVCRTAEPCPRRWPCPTGGGGGRGSGHRGGARHAGRVHRGLVGQGDGQLAERGGVERRRVMQPLHVGLGAAQLVAGEVGPDRGEAEFGGALGQHGVQRGQPRGERADLAGGQAGRVQALELGAERVVVPVDDHLWLAGQGVEPAQQLQVVLAELGQLLLEVGRGRLVVAGPGDRAELQHGRPVQVVGPHADDDLRGVLGAQGRVDLGGHGLAAAALRAEQALADRGAVAGQVHHLPAVGPGQVLGVGVGAAAAVQVGLGRVEDRGQPGARRGRVAQHHDPHVGRHRDRLPGVLDLRLTAHQLAERADLAQRGRARCRR